MSDRTDEKLSAFLDSELTAHDVDSLVNASRTQASEETLAHYQLISRVISGDKSRYSTLDVSHRVMAQIASEASPSRIQQARTSRIANWLSSAWLKPVAGIAVAGFVATVTIFVSQTQQPAQGPVNLQPLAQQQSYSPLKLELAADVRANAVAEQQRHQQVNNYLVSHSRSAAGTSYQGVVPYIRAVAFEQPDQPVGDNK